MINVWHFLVVNMEVVRMHLSATAKQMQVETTPSGKEPFVTDVSHFSHKAANLFEFD